MVTTVKSAAFSLTTKQPCTSILETARDQFLQQLGQKVAPLPN
jgi:hypothetical protein